MESSWNQIFFKSIALMVSQIHDHAMMRAKSINFAKILLHKYQEHMDFHPLEFLRY